MSGGAAHKVPATTVLLGTVLDLHVQLDSERRALITEWRGWAMLTSETAFELAPGRARLFLLKGKVAGQEHLDPDSKHAAREAYARWHQRDAQKLGEMNAPDAITYVQGRVLRIGYRSDKWSPRGRTHDYDHDFLEEGKAPPLLYTSHRSIERSAGACIVGGDMQITEGGID